MTQLITRTAICAALALLAGPALAQSAPATPTVSSDTAATTVTPDQVKPIRASRGGCNKSKPMT